MVRRREIKKRVKVDKIAELTQELERLRNQIKSLSAEKENLTKNPEAEADITRKKLNEYEKEMYELKRIIQEKNKQSSDEKFELVKTSELEKEHEKLRAQIESISSEKEELTQNHELNVKVIEEKNIELDALKRSIREKDSLLSDESKEKKELLKKLRKYEELYDGNSDSKPLIFEANDLETLENLNHYLKAVTNMPNTTKAKIKTLKKIIALIQGYDANSKDLIKKCKNFWTMEVHIFYKIISHICFLDR